MFACPGCGGDMRFEPSLQKLKCDHCDTVMDVQTYSQNYKKSQHMASETNVNTGSVDAEEAKRKAMENSMFTDCEQQYTNRPEFTTVIYTCPQCGGELMTDSSTAATFCSYCGSSTVLTSRVAQIKSPDFIIPFSKTKEDCEKAYKSLLRKSIFAPSYFRKDEQVERFRGIYMPYWIYAYEKKGHINTTGERSYRRGDYIYKEHYRVGFDVDANCAGVSYDASANFSDNLSQAIAPYDMGKAQYFDPAYMSGFYADVSDVNSETYADNGQRVVARECTYRVSRQLKTKSTVNTGGLVGPLTPKLTRTNLGYFPVWFLANKSKDGKRVSYAVVNGETGKIAADIPMDFGKFIIGTLILAIPIFLLMNFVFTFKPGTTLGIAFVLSIVAWIINNRQQNLIYTREHRLDDEGYVAKYGNIQELNPDKGVKVETKTKMKTSSGAGSIGGAIFAFIAGFAVIVYLSDVSSFIDDNLGVIVMGYLILGITALVALIIVRTTSNNKAKRSGTEGIYYKPSMKSKMKYFWKPIAAIALCGIFTLINTFIDPIAYGVALTAMGLVGWSFFDMMALHNKLTTSPLPQFNKRGGEENEKL